MSFRKISKVFITLFILVLVFHLSVFSKNINGKIISDTAGIKVIRVWGSHYERGFAQGYLLADNIRDIYSGYMQPFLGNYLEAIKNHLRVEKVIKIDRIFHEEAQGMLAGMKKAGVIMPNFDEYSILLSNAFLDLIGMSLFRELRDLRKSFGCSSLMNWGNATLKTNLAGKSVITRHLDWPVNDFVVNNQVIVIHIPKEKNEQNWLMIGFAGQISVLSGVNKSGISAFLHMLNDFNEENIPLPLEAYESLSFTLRKAIEQKDFNNDGMCSIEDIKTAVKSNKQGYAEGFIVSMLGPTNKNNGSTAAIAELTPTPPYITFRDESYNDNLNGDNLYTANFSVKRNNFRHYCRRYKKTTQAVNALKDISSLKAWEIMKSSSALPNNIQFMQYIPEDKTLKIAIYKDGVPAFNNKAYTLDLRVMLR